MSDTPRTDAQVFTVDVAFTSHDGLASEPKEVVEPDFARELERENAALREKAERYRLVTLRQDADNTALCNKLAALENQTQWECSCGGTDCEGMKENAALRRLIDDPEAMHSHYLRVGNGWEVWRAERVRGLERENESLIEDVRGLEPMVDRLERENVALRADVLEQCMLNAKGSEREYSLRGRIEQLERENVALRKENVKLRQVLEGQSDEIRTLHIANDAAFAALDAARKEAKP